jgi:hemerythrin-like metal-binding protein
MKINFQWTKDMSVDENNIDHQHQRLLEQLNKVIEAMVFGTSSKEVSEAVSFFDQYFREHFVYEENYMREHRYPALEEHKVQHGDFIKKYFAFKDKLDSGTNSDKLIMEIETYLGKWWIEHIGKEDQKYHYFINPS